MSNNPTKVVPRRPPQVMAARRPIYVMAPRRPIHDTARQRKHQSTPVTGLERIDATWVPNAMLDAYVMDYEPSISDKSDADDLDWLPIQGRPDSVWDTRQEDNDEIELVPSKQEGDNEKKSDPIPNGGLLAWTQVAGSFFLMFNTWYVVTEFLSHTVNCSRTDWLFAQDFD